MGELETIDARQACAHFVFPSRQEALAFANSIIERDWCVSVTYLKDHERWRATVKRHIQTLHREINSWLAALRVRAASMGGEYDGWSF